MEDALKASLLGSIAAGRLAIICGAGLSMASPSNLPSARAVSRICFDRYQDRIDPGIDPAIRDNLEAVAEYAKAHVDLGTVFIKTIVPWEQFSRAPNPGHEAVADLTITQACAAALTSNYDNLIERSGWQLCAPFPVSLDGAQATATQHQSPYLKFHGCGHIDQQRTVWTLSQFISDAEIARRKASCETWIATNLQEKDLLFVGFWSDWAYLNQAISLAFSTTHPRSVTVVDPSGVADLQTKAPDLWALAHQAGVVFTHVQASGDAFLAELREAFSLVYIREFLRLGRDAYATQRPGAAISSTWQQMPALSNDQLYSWRRDAEGRAANEPAVGRSPNASAEMAGFAHILLRTAGWTVKDVQYEKDGQSIRVVNAAGRFVNDTKRRFTQAPAVIDADTVVCAGAMDIPVPGDIVRDSDPADIVRGGSEARWIDLNTAIQELGL